MDRFVIIFSSLFVVVSCASPASLPPAPPPAAAPSSVASTSASPPPAAFDPKTWLAREVASGLTDAPFEIASPAVRGTVPSSAAPTLSEKSGHQVLSIPIGTQAPIECTFYSTAIDVAAYVTQLTRGTSTKLEVITTSVTEVGVEHESPTMRATFEYLAARPEGSKGAGLLKVAVQSSDAGVIGCMHDEYGYRDTFQRITKALFASRAYAKEPPVVPYETITRIDVNGAATGYARRVFQPVEGGSLQVRDYMAAVFVAAGRMLLAMDYAGVTVTDARGEIVSETFASGEQGALKHQIVVKRTRTGHYSVDGTSDGKEVHTSFETKSPLSTEIAQRAKLLALSAARRGEHRYFTFDDSPKKLGPLEKIYRAESDGGLLLSGEHDSRVKLDARGLIVEHVDLGGDPLVAFRRVFERGNF